MALANLRVRLGVQVLLDTAARAANEETRLASVHALGLTGDKTAAKLLIRILESSSESARLRGEAAEALAFCGRGSREVSSALIKALDDKSVEVRFFAAYALGFVGDLGAISPLRALTGDQNILPGYGSVSDEAAAALEQIEARAADIDRTH